MNPILTEIFNWAEQKLAFWEKLLLEKIIYQNNLSKDDYQECLQYLKEDENLKDKQTTRPSLRLSNSSIPETANKSNRRRYLHRISNVKNINALVENQELTFSKNLTVIYGKNGSGKSGYARLIGCAGFTRGNQEILGNVLSNSENGSPYAQITLLDNNNMVEIDFEGDSIPEMRGFYMFDSEAIQKHLQDQNELAFSPTGLKYLKILALETDKVRELLTKEIDERKQQKPPAIVWNGESNVSQLTESLDATTDLDHLRQLSHVSDEEKEKLSDLEKEIRDLENQKTDELIETHNQELQDINKLKEDLETIEQTLNPTTTEKINRLISEHYRVSQTINEYNLDKFRHPELTSTGTPEWSKFVQTASTLATEEHSDYPDEDDICLLCQQPLDKKSREHMHQLWQFVRQGAQVESERIERQISDWTQTFQNLDFDFFDERTAIHRYLKENYPDVFEAVNLYLEQIKQYREKALNTLENKTQMQETALEDIDELLDDVVQDINEKIEVLKSENKTEQIAKLEAEKQELEHRQILAQHLSEIENYVSNCKWITGAEKAGGDTKKITRKHNQLFEQHVTKKFLEKFRQTLEELGRPLHVDIETRGKKGQTLKQLVLQPSSADSKLDVNPEQVLSEGEKRAVAFADFITEITIDPECNGIVLDDPVTSLDLEWRKVIAEKLVSQSQKQQVIVFTHDIPFLYILNSEAEKQNTEQISHWITRGMTDNKPGYIFLENAPIPEQDYKKPTKAEDFYKKAKDEQLPEKHSQHLKNGMSALRTSYEALVIFELLQGVVQRYDDRLYITSLKRIVLEDSIVEEIDSTYGKLSRYIEGHLHPDGSPHESLTMDLLRQELDRFYELRKKIRKL